MNTRAALALSVCAALLAVPVVGAAQYPQHLTSTDTGVSASALAGPASADEYGLYPPPSTNWLSTTSSGSMNQLAIEMEVVAGSSTSFKVTCEEKSLSGADGMWIQKCIAGASMTDCHVDEHWYDLSGVQATGTLTFLAAASVAEDDEFTLGDGTNEAVTFVISKGTSAATWSTTNVELDVSYVTSAIEVADHFRNIMAGSVYASGTITALAKASMTEGDYFTISDGVTAHTYTFSTGTLSHTPSATSHVVDISSDTTAINVADRVRLAVAGVKATGQLTALAKASMTEGDYFDLNDGVSTIRFTFSTGTLSHTETATAREIDISGVSTANDVSDVIRAAITSSASHIVPDTDGVAQIDLECDYVGYLCNETITENLDSGTLSPSGMSGGTGVTTTNITTDAAGAAEIVFTGPATFAANVDIVESMDSGTLTPNGMTYGTPALSLDLTADAAGTAQVDLTNNLRGPQGNVTIVEDLDSGTLTPVGMSGGTGGETHFVLNLPVGYPWIRCHFEDVNDGTGTITVTGVKSRY